MASVAVQKRKIRDEFFGIHPESKRPQFNAPSQDQKLLDVAKLFCKGFGTKEDEDFATGASFLRTNQCGDVVAQREGVSASFLNTNQEASRLFGKSSLPRLRASLSPDPASVAKDPARLHPRQLTHQLSNNNNVRRKQFHVGCGHAPPVGFFTREQVHQLLKEREKKVRRECDHELAKHVNKIRQELRAEYSSELLKRVAAIRADMDAISDGGLPKQPSYIS